MNALEELPKGPGIYCWLNTVNGKRYIGQSKNIRERCRAHRRQKRGTCIHSAIRKYGLDAFEVDALEECANELLAEREMFWIAELNTLSPNGYNLTTGGELNDFAPEVRARIRATQSTPEFVARKSSIGRAIWTDPVYRTKVRSAMSISHNTPEYRAKFSAIVNVRRTDPERSAKVSANMSAAAIVRCATHHYGPRISARNKARWADPEYRARMSARSRDRISKKWDAIAGLKLATDYCQHCGWFMSPSIKCSTRKGRIICIECRRKGFHDFNASKKESTMNTAPVSQ